MLQLETARHPQSSAIRPAANACRFCRTELRHLVIDLGMSPLSETFLKPEQLHQTEIFYPLRAYICQNCLLMQVEEHVSGQAIFQGEYAYFSSYSDSWLRHAAAYVDMVVRRLRLNQDSFVVELASNDGYLLTNFVDRGIPCLGIEPAENVAEAAVRKGVPTRTDYFGVDVARRLAAENLRPDLILGINVLAHVPNINDFVGGIKILLAPGGVVTMEFPHVVNLIEQNQFDTIYQEHYFYYSFHSVRRIFAHHGLTMFDVEELPSHGGSLRIYARHTEDGRKPISPAVEQLIDREARGGYTDIETYTNYSERVAKAKRNLLAFLIQAKQDGKQVIGYGAPGKGNTLLNYCGIREDFLNYLVDRNPYKQGRFAPGTHIPIYSTERIAETRPDFILILPWNLRKEISRQLDYTREWGAKFVVPIPELDVF